MDMSSLIDEMDDMASFDQPKSRRTVPQKLEAMELRSPRMESSGDFGSDLC